MTLRRICALCGRDTLPAVFIGLEAVGPTCARKSGLLALAKKGGARVTLSGYRRTPKAQGPQNMELFEDQEKGETA